MSAADKTVNGSIFLALLCRLQVREPTGRSADEGQLNSSLSLSTQPGNKELFLKLCLPSSPINSREVGDWTRLHGVPKIPCEINYKSRDCKNEKATSKLKEEESVWEDRKCFVLMLPTHQGLWSSRSQHFSPYSKQCSLLTFINNTKTNLFLIIKHLQEKQKQTKNREEEDSKKNKLGVNSARLSGRLDWLTAGRLQGKYWRALPVVGAVRLCAKV